MARTASYTRSKNGMGVRDPSMGSGSRSRRDAGCAQSPGPGDGDGDGLGAGAAGAAGTSGPPGPGAPESPGPVKVGAPTLGTCSETSLTIVLVVSCEALRNPSTY